MATIKDVARMANVSPSTVSRVIADSPRISQETKERVRDAMKKVHYYPNMIARSLVRRSSQTLGLVLSRSTESAFSNPFFSEIIRGISKVTQKYHYSLMLATAEDYAEEAKLSLRMLTEKRVDGLLLLAPRVNDKLIHELSAENFPFVVLGRAPDNTKCYSVNNDNIQAAYLAVRHLLTLGHQRIAILNGSEEYTFCQDRFEGYRTAFREFGIEIDLSLVRNGNSTQEDGYRSTRELLNLAQPPTALFCVDDIIAVGAYQGVKESNLRIPDDISIIGFNDDPLASVIEPHLTTVRIPIYEMGVTATQNLIQAVEGKEIIPWQHILSSELIIRESCSPKI